MRVLKFFPFKFFLICTGVGVLTGTASTAFLNALDLVTRWHHEFPVLLFFLPLAGLFTGWVYQKLNPKRTQGIHIIFEKLRGEVAEVSPTQGPRLAIFTWLSHLVGAPVGREGTLVQLGASVATLFEKLCLLDSSHRLSLLRAGVCSAFACVLNAPFAGLLFGFEITGQWRRKRDLLPSALATFIAIKTSLFLKPRHFLFPPIDFDFVSIKTFFGIFFFGAVCGLTARFFIFFLHSFEGVFSSTFSSKAFRGLFGGMILLVFFLWEGSHRFEGLGIELIQQAFLSPTPLFLPFGKMLLTAFALAVGFRGGEFTPLVFMGATLGSFVGFLIGGSDAISFYAALGFVGIFAGASRTPLTSAVLAWELFGWPLFLPALVVTTISSRFTGQKRIYKNLFPKRPKSI